MRWLVRASLLFLLAIPANVWAVQLARPVSDGAQEECSPTTGTDSYAMVNDDSFTNTIMCSVSCYVPTCGSCYLFTKATWVKLGSLTDPATSSGHKLRIGALSYSGYTVYLYQGYEGTRITGWTDFKTTTQEASYTLDGASADAITDYSDLWIWTGVGGWEANDLDCMGEYDATDWSEIAYVIFEVPDAGGGGGATRRVMVVP